MYHYIFFDLDGTLTDSKEGIFKSVRYALEKLGRPVPGDDILTLFVGPPLADSFMNFCGMTRPEADEAVRVFRERYAVKGLYENAAVPGGPELLRRLKERGYVLALASSKPVEHCRPIVERYGYAPYLDVVAGSEGESDETKADIIRKAMTQLNITEAEKPRVLMVGDRKFDVLGARQCGIDCVGLEVCRYGRPGELAEAGAVAVLESMEALEDFILSH